MRLFHALALFLVLASGLVWAADYVCPMHCEGQKTYHAEGTCPVCKMNLEEVSGTKSRPLNTIDFRVDLSSEQEVPPAGVPTKLKLSIRKTKDNSTVSDFDSHGGTPKLAVMKQGLDWLRAAEVTKGTPGDWNATVTFPNAGNYLVLASFTPRGEREQIFPLAIKVGAKPTGERALSSVEDSDTAAKTFEPRSFKFGVPSKIKFTPAGLPPKAWGKLDGKPARIWVMSEDTTLFPLVHLTESAAVPPGKFEFHVTFPRKGNYRVWIQTLPDGQPRYFTQTVRVE